MIREVKFESQDRRIKQILACLNLNISQVAEYFFCPKTREITSIL